MVDRIHRHTADGGTNTKPATASGFSERLLVVVTVANFANRGAAIAVKQAKFGESLVLVRDAENGESPYSSVLRGIGATDEVFGR